MTLTLSLLVLLNVEQAPSIHPWYAERAFYGFFGCLTGVTGRVKPGQPLLVFEKGQSPTIVEVDWVREAPTARSHATSQDDEVDYCFRTFFRHGDPEWVARLRVPEAGGLDVFLAIVLPSEGVLAVGGNRERLSSEDSLKVARSVASAVPAPYRGRGVLTQAYRYAPEQGHDFVELYLGVPTLNRSGQLPPIKSIKIHRSFLVGKRVLAAEEYSRRSGVEERVDSEIVELTRENWSESDTESTIGFLSRDGGATWDRLSENVGFEGIWWNAQSLREGLPWLLHTFLYTSH